MEHLERYSDEELSLRVFNEEGLYRIRHSSTLESTLRERFTFTEEQLDDLQTSLEADEE